MAVFKVFSKIIPAFLCVFLLAGCAETQFVSHVVKKQFPGSDDKTVYKVGNPYKIEGHYYYPKESFSHSETGIASWYGPGFHGKMTANGEKYDKYALTAAHRTLQMPSIVRVTNLENGRSIKVRVNDRGPFSKGRVIDMSKKGAELLGFKNQGTARVRVDLLPLESRIVADAAKQGRLIDVHEAERLASLQRGREPAKPVEVARRDQMDMLAQQEEPFLSVRGTQVQPVEIERIGGETVQVLPVEPTSIFVQAGAFSVYENAYKLSQSLKNIGPMQLSETVINGQKFYRVRMGPFQRVEDADAALNRLWNMPGTSNARIVIDESRQTR